MNDNLLSDEMMASGLAALFFAATFLAGSKLHPFRSLMPDRRNLISFAAGSSSAYVFVYLMPELSEIKHRFTESANFTLYFEGMAIYYAALIGFMVLYGFEHLRNSLRISDNRGAKEREFGVHLAGYGAYVWLVSYLLTHQLEETTGSVALYCFAMCLHFLTMDHALNEEHGSRYQDKGRFALAGASLLGWVTGLLVALPVAALALLTAFISGAIIMNSSLSELPSEKDGRIMPFIAGGIFYGLILLLL
jgi:hypothetical protein